MEDDEEIERDNDGPETTKTTFIKESGLWSFGGLSTHKPSASMSDKLLRWAQLLKYDFTLKIYTFVCKTTVPSVSYV